MNIRIPLPAPQSAAVIAALWAMVKIELDATRSCDASGSQAEQVCAVRRAAAQHVPADEWTLSEGDESDWLHADGFILDQPGRDNEDEDIPALTRLWAVCTTFIIALGK